MIANRYRLVVAIFFLSAGVVRAETADEMAISRLLRGMFDKPGAVLSIAPVVVAGNHAIADWSQSDMGGRALLRRTQAGWAVVLCAGDAIRSRDALKRAGVAADDAVRLERDLAASEATLSPAAVAMFSRFEGLVMMDAAEGQPASSDRHHRR